MLHRAAPPHDGIAPGPAATALAPQSDVPHRLVYLLNGTQINSTSTSSSDSSATSAPSPPGPAAALSKLKVLAVFGLAAGLFAFSWFTCTPGSYWPCPTFSPLLLLLAP